MFIILGLIIAFVLIAVFSNRATRLCRWRERRGDHTVWLCAYCGKQTDGDPGRPPQMCLRDNSGLHGKEM